MKKLNAKTISLCGIFCIFVVLALCIGSTVPIFLLAGYMIGSLFTALVVMETNLLSGFAFFIAASFLTFFLSPNKLVVGPYLLFFGHYGLWKWILDQKRNKVLRWTLKMVVVGICLILMLITCRGLIGQFRITNSVFLFFVGEVLYLVYDYMFDRALTIYRRRIQRMIK